MIVRYEVTVVVPEGAQMGMFTRHGELIREALEKDKDLAAEVAVEKVEVHISSATVYYDPLAFTRIGGAR